MLIECPNCGHQMIQRLGRNSFPCPNCTEVVRLANTQQPHDAIPRRQQTMSTSHYQAMVELRKATLARRAGNRLAEVVALRRALYYDPQYLKAHIRLGRIAPYPEEQRKHLLAAYRLAPDNHEVITLLSRLQATMSAAQANEHFGDDAPVQRAQEAQVETTLHICPQCRGTLRIRHETRQVVCIYCGYYEDLAQEDLQQRDLSALLRERIQKPRYEVDSTAFRCGNCAASWVTNNQLMPQCPYCSSAQIVVRDDLGAFAAPDGLIPLRISREKAHEVVHEAVDTFRERLHNLWNGNRIATLDLNAVYLPFWVFDALIDIRMQSVFDFVAFRPLEYPTREAARSDEAYRFIREHGYHIGVVAERTVRNHLVARLGRYDQKLAVPYGIGVLDSPAELPDVAVEQAVERVRAILSRAIGTHYAKAAPITFVTEFEETNVRQLLVPVWLGVIHETDGDTRPFLVNGSTGRVVLGSARSNRNPNPSPSR